MWVGSASGEDTGEAALIATFYGPSGGQAIQSLHNQFYRRWASKPQEHPLPDDWENSAEEKYGHRFAPPGRAALDTMAVQVALNAPGNAGKAWEDMRHTLRRVLYEDQTLETAGHAETVLKRIWGYSLVYQAVLREDVDPDAALTRSIGSIRRLEPFSEAESSEGFEPLAVADVPGGRVWLLGIPDRGDGWAAATVYCAMGPWLEEETLLDRFYGPAAVLLTPDLIAHKGYYQMRQYRDEDLEHSYEERLRDLRQTSVELLQEVEQAKVRRRLGDLSNKYYQLVPVVSQLKELHVGIARQLKNYELWQKQHAVGNDIVGFHRDQLEAAAVELDLMVQPLEDGLDTADKAVSLAQAQMTSKTEEENQRRHREITTLLISVEWTLVAVTAALALVELTLGWNDVQEHVIEQWDNHKVAGTGIGILIVGMIFVGARELVRMWRRLRS